MNPDTTLKERRAIESFVNLFGGNYAKVDQTEATYKILDSEMELISYVDIIHLPTVMTKAFPLPIFAHRLVKLTNKRLSPTVIWACEDGIIYGKIIKMRGKAEWGNIPPLNNYSDLLIYYDQQANLKFVAYE